MFRRSQKTPIHEETLASPSGGAMGAGGPAGGVAPGTATGGTNVGAQAAPVASERTTSMPATGSGGMVGAGATPLAAAPTAAAVPVASTRRERRISRSTGTRGAGPALATVGLLTVLMGAWVGIVPFVGPLFGYSADGSGAWTWNFPHAMLWLIPGAVAVFFGLMMMGSSARARAGMSRIGPMWAGFVVAVCGAWLVIAPLAWPVLGEGREFRAASPLRELTYWVGYSLGTGVILALLGGAAIGIAMLSRSRVSESEVATTVPAARRVAA